MTKEDLTGIAQDRDIQGRSTMTKDELVDAIVKDQDGAASGATEGTSTPAAQPSKEAQAATAKTDPTKSANENVEAGGHPTGATPGGAT